MTDYIRAIPPVYTRAQRVQMKWSWFVDVWRRIGWMQAHSWRRFEMIWPRLGWAHMRALKQGPFAED